MSVKTRFAPSPTGYLHSGNYRTAVFSYLFAKKHGGSFVLRIEDTDRERSKKEYEDNILDSLAWLDLPHDEFARQSERVKRHIELLEKLVGEGKAYVSEEESKNEPGKTVRVVRLKNPGTRVVFNDLIRGEIAFDTAELGDFVIGRAIDDPLFHFAVVADDADMGITHVIRGEDHISNTPRQILIQEALGMPRPKYAHLPLILASDRSKLSKRKGARALTEYRDMGILPEAMLNYLAYLGWNPGDDREYLSREELIEAFSLERVQSSGAMFDETKLLSVNQHWMRKLSDDKYLDILNIPEFEPRTPMTYAYVQLCKDRARTFQEARELLENLGRELWGMLKIDRSVLLAKEPEGAPGFTKSALEGLLEPLEALSGPVSPEAVKDALMPLADRNPKENGGRGAVLWPFRYALSGAERSPDPFTLVSILGTEEARLRILKALDILS